MYIYAEFIDDYGSKATIRNDIGVLLIHVFL